MATERPSQTAYSFKFITLMLQMQVIQGDCHSMASPVRMFSVPPPLHKPRNTLSLQTLTFVTVSSSFYKILVSVTSPFPDPSHCTCVGVGPKAIRIFHIGVKVLISTLVSPLLRDVSYGQGMCHFPDYLLDGNQEWPGCQDYCENFCIIFQTLLLNNLVIHLVL